MAGGDCRRNRSPAPGKVHAGPHVDNEEEFSLPVWAGEIPLRVLAEAPIPAAAARFLHLVQAPFRLPLPNGWGPFTRGD